MSDVNFDCPACAQNIEAPLKMAGMQILCPGCRALLQIPWPSEAAAQRAQRKAKSATSPITVEGGIPPAPEKRRVVIKRAAGGQA
jgi:hypothetical protein